MPVELYPHQTKALGELKNGKILKGGVGTGKSITAMAYFYGEVCGGCLPLLNQGTRAELRTPRDLYIITTAKKRDDLDWEKEALPFGFARERENSHGGVQIKVDSWNNIPNYKDVKDAFFIFDEQRLVGSGAWVKAFLKIAAANQWIMLSATPGDNWMDYIPVLIANGFYKNRTEFIRRHVVYNNFSQFPKVDHFVETGRLDRLRRLLIVDMPYARHTTRHVRTIPVGHNADTLQRVVRDRWHVFEDRPIKDVAELFATMRKVVNSDPERVGAIMELMEKHPKLIIFYNFNYELDALRTLAATLNYPMAEWNGHKHQDIPKEDKWIYLVQYTAGAEGWNCIETNAMVFYSLNYSYKIFEQSMGRIDRLNTPFKDLYYYVLRSNTGIDNAINKALTTKKNFSEKSYAKKQEWDLAA